MLVVGLKFGRDGIVDQSHDGMNRVDDMWGVMNHSQTMHRVRRVNCLTETLLMREINPNLQTRQLILC